MALFTIADLHLPGKEGNNKSMEIFGNRWIGGVDKLIYNWWIIQALLTSKETLWRLLLSLLQK